MKGGIGGGIGAGTGTDASFLESVTVTSVRWSDCNFQKYYISIIIFIFKQIKIYKPSRLFNLLSTKKTKKKQAWKETNTKNIKNKINITELLIILF